MRGLDLIYEPGRRKVTTSFVYEYFKNALPIDKGTVPPPAEDVPKEIMGSLALTTTEKEFVSARTRNSFMQLVLGVIQ